MQCLHLVSSDDFLNVSLNVTLKELVTVSVDVADSSVESIKVSHGTDSVGAHIDKIEPLPDLHKRHLVVLADSVNRVTSRSKDGRLDSLTSLALFLVSIDTVRHRMLMIKENAVE